MKQVIVFAIILAVAVTAFVHLNNEATKSGPSSVEVPAELQECKAEADHCMVVDRSCGLCCDYVAINSAYEDIYNKAFNETCDDYRGKVCNCAELDGYPDCSDQKCELVPWP